MDYPPASLTGKLPIGATAERDAINALAGNVVLRELCGGSATTDPRIYLGIRPQDTVRPYILVSKTSRSHVLGSCAGYAGVAHVSQTVVVTIVDEHYQRCMDLEQLAVMVLENSKTPCVRQWHMTGTEYPADLIDDGTGRGLYNAVLTFDCEMLTG